APGGVRARWLLEPAAVEDDLSRPAPPAGAAAGLVQVPLAESQERAGVPFHPPRDQVDLLVGRVGRTQPQGLQAASVLPDGLQPVLLGEGTAPRVGPRVLVERLGGPGGAGGPADAGIVVGTPGGRPVQLAHQAQVLDQRGGSPVQVVAQEELARAVALAIAEVLKDDHLGGEVAAVAAWGERRLA